jgi:hypothetical protein
VQDVAPEKEAQAVSDPAAMCRRSLGSVARAGKGVIPPGVARKPRSGGQKCHATRGGTEQASNTACGTPGFPAFRGDYARVDKLILPHEAAGRLRARRSARPCDIGLPISQ